MENGYLSASKPYCPATKNYFILLRRYDDVPVEARIAVEASPNRQSLSSGPVYIKNLKAEGNTVADLAERIKLGPNMSNADIHVQ